MNGDVNRTDGTGIILIAGLPRSGTTWIGKIFDSHRKTLYRHEPDSVLRDAAIPLVAPSEEIPRLEVATRHYVEKLITIRTPKVSGKTPVFKKEYYTPLQYYLRSFQVYAYKAYERLGGAPAVADLFDLARRPDVKLVWKSIESIGRLGLLARSLPGLRIVFIVRHPCGQIGSVLRGEAARTMSPNSEDYDVFAMLLDSPLARARGLSLEALRACRPEERQAWRWVLFNDKAMADIAGLANCRAVRYEDLCADPLTVTRELFAFTGLDWDRQTEDFIGASTSSERSAYHSLFKSPLAAAEKWRQELPQDTVDRILRVTEDSQPGRLFAS